MATTRENKIPARIWHIPGDVREEQIKLSDNMIDIFDKKRYSKIG